jgi:hypothetical protein
MSALTALQQSIEPGVKHIVEVRDTRRGQQDDAIGEGLLRRLVACLESDPIDREEARFILLTAKRVGLDVGPLYQEAVRRLLAVRPEREAGLPALAEIAPPDE